MSTPFLRDKKPTVVPRGSAGERSGSTQSERRRVIALLAFKQANAEFCKTVQPASIRRSQDNLYESVYIPAP